MMGPVASELPATHESRRREPLPTERALLQGVAVTRWAVWAWMAITTFVPRHHLDHPAVAAIFVGTAVLTASWDRLRGLPFWVWVMGGGLLLIGVAMRVEHDRKTG